MVPFYLDFEEPIKTIDEQILQIKSDSGKNNLLEKLEKELSITIKNIHSKLSRWQRVQLARHPNRPYSLDYIKYFSKNFYTKKYILRTLCLLGLMDYIQVIFLPS